MRICSVLPSSSTRLHQATRFSSTAQKKRICTVLHQHAIGKHIRWKPLKGSPFLESYTYRGGMRRLMYGGASRNFKPQACRCPSPQSVTPGKLSALKGDVKEVRVLCRIERGDGRMWMARPRSWLTRICEG